MRIALLSLDRGVPFGGSRKGASIHLQSMAAALLRAGHEVTALCAEPGERGSVSGLLARGLELLPVVKPAGPGDLPRQFERARPDLVIERLSLEGPAGALAARDAGLSHIYEVNAPLDEEAARHRGLADGDAVRARLVAGFEASRGAVAVSDEVATWVLGLAPAGFPVAVEANGAGPECFEPPAEEAVARVRERLQLRPDEFTIGFVGAFRPWHDLPALVEAAALVARDLPSRLLLVGDGAARTTVLRLATERSARVTFAGHVPHDEVPAHLATMDAVAVPYASEADYFSPLKLFEAMAAGRAIVASATRPVSRILTQGRHALLVPPGDAEALAVALRDLARWPELRRRLGDEARNAAAAHHTWDAVASRVLAFAGRVSRAAGQSCGT